MFSFGYNIFYCCKSFFSCSLNSWQNTLTLIDVLNYPLSEEQQELVLARQLLHINVYQTLCYKFIFVRTKSFTVTFDRQQIQTG